MVQLLPPLNSTAGRDRVSLTLRGEATIQGVIDGLLELFDDPRFRLHLYDTEGRLVPSWCAFINGRPVPLSRGEGVKTPVAEGDEISFLLMLAGG